MWGNNTRSGPSFMGGDSPNSVGLDAPLSYIDPLPCIDRCHDIYFVVCKIVNDSQTNKQTRGSHWVG